MRTLVLASFVLGYSLPSSAHEVLPASYMPRYADMYQIYLSRLAQSTCQRMCQYDARLNMGRAAVLMGDSESAHLNWDLALELRQEETAELIYLRAYSALLSGDARFFEEQILKMESSRALQVRILASTMDSSKPIAEYPKEVPHLSQDARKHLFDLQSLPYKNPVIAGSLSLIPGGGFAYLGLWQSAASSFFLSMICYLTAAELYHRGLQLSAASAALIGSVFHIGGAFGAMDAALDINQKARKQSIDSFRDGVLPEIVIKMSFDH